MKKITIFCFFLIITLRKYRTQTLVILLDTLNLYILNISTYSNKSLLFSTIHNDIKTTRIYKSYWYWYGNK